MLYELKFRFVKLNMWKYLLCLSFSQSQITLTLDLGETKKIASRGVTQYGDLYLFIYRYQYMYTYLILIYKFLIVMKKQLGIDLGALTDAQKKMCVQLLAKTNVQVDQKNSQYVATLKIPTDKMKQFYKNSEKKEKTNKKQITLDSKKDLKQNIKKNQQSHPELYGNGKKPLNRVVKMIGMQKLMEFHPSVQIYIYPKRMSMPHLTQIIQNVYSSFWNMQRSTKAHKPFMQYLYNNISKTYKSKIKLDQFIVNFVDSISHFQHKNNGVKVFNKFISQEYNGELLAYFLVLRALLQEIIGQRILDRTKSQTFPNNYKIKWNLYESEIEEECVREFLSVSSADKNLDSVFLRLTKHMYYSEEKKNNFIQVFDLFQFLLQEFKKPEEQSTQKLQLSYSHDSSLNQLFNLTSNKNYFSMNSQPLEVNVHLQQIAQEKDQDYPNTIDEQFTQETHKKIDDLCSKMQINSILVHEIKEVVNICLDSIIEGDKSKWIDVTKIEGNQSELFYIQNLQKQYNDLKERIQSPIILNSLIRKFINGPGIRKIIYKSVSF